MPSFPYSAPKAAATGPRTTGWCRLLGGLAGPHWQETALNIKMTLVVIAIVLVCLHVFVTKGANRLLQTLILLDSLAIVLAATAL